HTSFSRDWSSDVCSSDLAERIDELRALIGIEPSDAVRFATQQAAALTGRLVDLASGLATNVFKFALTLVTLYVLYLEGGLLVARSEERRLGTDCRLTSPQ